MNDFLSIVALGASASTMLHLDDEVTFLTWCLQVLPISANLDWYLYLQSVGQSCGKDEGPDELEPLLSSRPGAGDDGARSDRAGRQHGPCQKGDDLLASSLKNKVYLLNEKCDQGIVYGFY